MTRRSGAPKPREGARETVAVVVGAAGPAAVGAPVYDGLRRRCSLFALPEPEALALERIRDVPMVLIDAGVVDPVAVARHLARVDAATEIAILAADGQRAAVEERLRRSPIPGGRATVYDLARPDLVDILDATLDRVQRRARFRSTIDVVNRRLATPTAPQARPTIAVDHLLAGILTGARDPIIAVDASGTVVVWNAAAERVIGLAASEAYGKPLREALARITPLDALLRLLDQGAGGEVTCAIEGGATLHASVNPLREAAGGAAIMLYDITGRVRDELALRNTTEELARSNKDLEQFAYIAAHDLQEPLRGISMFADILQRRPALRQDEGATRYLAKITASAARMRDLIQAVLGFSTIGREAIARESVDVADLVASAVENLSSAVAERSARVRCTASTAVLGDRALLVQVIQNLVANAIKFQPSGRQPDVRIAATGDGAMVRVLVMDNGIGIRPEHLAKLFKVFQRLHGGDEYAGTGIGLATCRRIIELHGGRIWVDSVFGSGSTFSLTLPAGSPS